MSNVARRILVIALLAGAFFFVLIGMALGAELPMGAAPFYVLAALTGIGAIVVFFVRGGSPASQATDGAEPNEDQSVYSMDLTRLTGAGWLLLLVTFVVAVVTVGIFFYLFPDQDDEGQETMAFVAFLAAAGVFVGGRAFYKAKGIRMLREK